MQLLNWLSSILLAAVAVLATAELIIKTTYKPENCTVFAFNDDVLNVHYVGKLSDGTEFDSSYSRGSPLPLTLGAKQVIKGWEEGLLGMCVGEKRTLIIPPHLAYGSRGAGGIIPPDATLTFDVELVSLEKKNNHEEL